MRDDAIYNDLICWVLGWVEDEPGIWTARLCRLLNGLPEIERNIIHCGLCIDYANPRKRARAARFAEIPTLPGFEPPYQLHAPCSRMQLRRLQGILRRLECATMVFGEQGSKVPDSRNWRGWDFATRWYPQP